MIARIPHEADAEIFAAYDSMTRARKHLKRIAKRYGVSIEAVYQRAWRAGFTTVTRKGAGRKAVSPAPANEESNRE